jgi:hypothetical protein
MEMMDKRCLRCLKELPESICSLAVERLKAMARMSRNTPYSQERELPGCPFYVLDKDANYCFFKYISDNESKEHSIIEICELMCITQAAVYESLRRGISKMKKKESYKLLNLKKKT